MHKSFAVLFFCGILLMVCACSSDKTTSTVYTDSLVLGTGVSGWNILGESTTFINDPSITGMTIYYRIESKAFLQGLNLEFDVYRNTSDGFELVHIIPINTYFQEHVVVGSFVHTWGAGSFKATASLGAGEIVGVKEFTVTNK
jgi:hypothetical protein